MLLKIYTLNGIKYQGEVKSLNAKTAVGEITVLDGHRPLISILKKGEIKVVDKNNQTSSVTISSGFLEVGAQNSVNILAKSDNI